MMYQLDQTYIMQSIVSCAFDCLPVAFQSDKVLTVRDALEGLVKKESLQDYTCSKTKQEVLENLMSKIKYSEFIQE